MSRSRFTLKSNGENIYILHKENELFLYFIIFMIRFTTQILITARYFNVNRTCSWQMRIYRRESHTPWCWSVPQGDGYCSALTAALSSCHPHLLQKKGSYENMPLRDPNQSWASSLWDHNDTYTRPLQTRDSLKQHRQQTELLLFKSDSSDSKI